MEEEGMFENEKIIQVLLSKQKKSNAKTTNYCCFCFLPFICH